MNNYFKLFASVVLAFLMAFGSIATTPDPVPSGSLDSLCRGDFFNPVTHPNWNNFFPITMLGKAWGGSNSDNPPLMTSNATCNCPSLLLQGAPMLGLNVGYWRPYKVIDVSVVPGCALSLDGAMIIDGYEHNFATPGEVDGNASRQVMSWNYDLLGIIGLFETFLCSNLSGGLDLAYDSNLDPTMNGMPSGTTGESEAVTFFKNSVMLLACFPDTVAALVYHPLDFMPFCSGANTPSFPYGNKVSYKAGPAQTNFKIVNDHIFKQSARFIEWLTIGPTAQCFAHPSYFPMKSAYRFNRVYPFLDNDDRYLSMGAPLAVWDLWSKQPPAMSSTSFLIWKAHQCCVKFIP